MELNHEVIKIFIESKLVRQYGFALIDDELKKRQIVFRLNDSILTLSETKNGRKLISISIPNDIESADCMSFAIKSYLRISEVIEKEKL